MIVDFRQADSGVLRGDVCIIGAGAVGITMAREFIGEKRDVIVLEGGGYEIEAESQALYGGENVGQPYFDLETARLRFFGGSTNHWGGWCAPLTEMDLAKRPWVPRSGWSLTRPELLPFYLRAQPIFELGPFEHYSESTWETLGIEELGLDKTRLSTCFYQQSIPPLRFGKRYREELKNASNVAVHLHANVTNIQLSEDGRRVTHLDVASLDGRRSRVEAEHFVLACGGIENPRLLLNSKAVHRTGLGNHHDQVGRCFMEHPAIECAELFERSNNELGWRFDWFRSLNVMAVMCPSARLQESEQILDFAAMPRAVYEPNVALKSAKEIAKSAGRLELPADLDEKVFSVVTDFDDLAAATYARYWFGSSAKYNHVTRLPLRIRSEQQPNPDSRVVLTAEKDALGMQKANLDWRLTELDLRTVRVMVKTVASELGRLRLARLRAASWLEHGWEGSGVEGGNHHMGTTRMSDDPKQGVVDRNCKVHGVENLFIGGSSVFPTSGWANPTLTIVALALRLSDHLKSEFS